jgi:hypothetical protein
MYAKINGLGVCALNITKDTHSPLKAAVYSIQLKLKDNTCVQEYQTSLKLRYHNIIIYFLEQM